VKLAFFSLGLCAFGVVAAACTVSANVGELEALPEGGANSGEAGVLGDATPSPDGSLASSSDAGAPDGSPDPTPIDAGCGVAFAHATTSGFVDIQVINGPPPNANGGTIVLGTYVLITMRSYFAMHTGTMQVRETIRVRGSVTAGAVDTLTEARSATGTFATYPLHGETFTWQRGGATPAFFITPECPKKDFQKTGTFKSEADTLMIFDDETGFERVYRRVP